jgi:hypothetical protein
MVMATALLKLMFVALLLLFTGSRGVWARPNHKSDTYITKQLRKSRPQPPRPYANVYIPGVTAVPLGKILHLHSWLVGHISSSFAQRMRADEAGRRRLFDLSRGVLIGDYYFQPNLIFCTDNHLDNANLREFALRQEMDQREAQRRGEIPAMDGLSLILRGRTYEAPTDQGFQVAAQISKAVEQQQTEQPPEQAAEHQDTQSATLATSDNRPPAAPAPQP